MIDMKMDRIGNHHGEPNNLEAERQILQTGLNVCNYMCEGHEIRRKLKQGL